MIREEWLAGRVEQLLVLHPQLKVLGREPHLLAHQVSGGLGTMVVCGRRVLVCGSSENGPGLGPGLAATTDDGLDRRAGGFPLQSWEQQWLEAVGTLEG